MSSTNRIRLGLVWVAVVVLGFVIFEFVDDLSHEKNPHADYRVPVANPPVDPNRPDLFEEPRIDE